MQPISIKLMSIIGLMVTLFIVIGCGSSDPLLDEEVFRYTADVDSFGAGGDVTDEINVVRATCDGVPFSGVLFPFDAEVTVSSFVSDAAAEADTPPAEFIVESYEFFLTPVSGTYVVGGNELVITRDVMPNLNAAGFTSTTRGRRSISSPVVRPGGSYTFDVPIWSAGDKDAYIEYLSGIDLLTTAGAQAELTLFSYDLQIVVHCRTNGDDTFTIRGETPVFFGNYIIDGECAEDEE